MTRNPAPDSNELNNTLARLRAMQQQTTPPTRTPNPLQGGAPRTGGNPNGNITATLSTAQMGAIGDKVRECWTKDGGALDLERMSVQLLVAYDEAGTARAADPGPDDAGRVSGDPRVRVFFERARRAVLDSRCANLPIPRDRLGTRGTLTFRFRP